MKRIKMVFNFFLLCVLASTPVFAQNIIVNPETPGSIIIHKLAVENLEDYTSPANGMETNVSGINTLSGITFTVTRVSDDTTDPGNVIDYAGEAPYNRSLPTDEGGEAKFLDLPHGVYLVHEEESPAVTSAVDDFLVNIPMTNPTGDGFLYDVHVYPKNQLISLPGFGMYVDDPETMYVPAGLGDEIPWYITAEVPKDISSASLYKVSCTLNPFFEYIDSSIAVTAENASGSQINLALNSDFSFSNQDGKLDIELTASGKTALSEILADNFVPVMTIAYSTSLNINEDNFQQASGIPLFNTADFYYTNSLGIPFTAAVPEEQLPYVYTGGINITKVDSRNEGTKLPGAVFNLYSSLADANSGNNPIPGPTGEGNWSVVTDGEGKAYFYGLPYGEAGEEYNNGAATYYLVETQAPEGYNLVGAPIEAVVNAASHLDTNPVMVRDNSGFLLPITGGTGTALFTITGLVLIAVASYMIYKSIYQKKQR